MNYELNRCASIYFKDFPRDIACLVRDQEGTGICHVLRRAETAQTDARDALVNLRPIALVELGEAFRLHNARCHGVIRVTGDRFMSPP